MNNYKFTPHELRIGSVVNYTDVTYYEDGDTMISKLDWQDLKWLTEQSDYFNQCHSPIQITPELLVKMGLKESGETFHYLLDIEIECVNEMVFRVYFRGHLIKWVSYIHELQSIVYDLIGVWLELS